MNRPVSNIKRILLCLAIFAADGVAWGTERFPPPDFSDHKLPKTEVPDVRRSEILHKIVNLSPQWYDYLDIAFLVSALALASYFAVFKRSRRGLFALSIVSLLWLGFWRHGCICPIGAIQNVAPGDIHQYLYAAICRGRVFRIAVGVYALLRPHFLRGGVPVGRRAGVSGTQAHSCSAVARSYAWGFWHLFISVWQCCFPSRARRFSSAATTRSSVSSA